MIQDFSPSIGLVFKNFLINCLLGIYLQTYIDTMLSQPYLIPTPEKLPIMFFTKKKEEKKITTKIGSTLNRIQLFLYNFGGAIYFVSQCIIIYNSLIFFLFFFISKYNYRVPTHEQANKYYPTRLKRPFRSRFQFWPRANATKLKWNFRLKMRNKCNTIFITCFFVRTW